MTRREILLAGLLGPLFRAEGGDAALFAQIFEAVWIAVRLLELQSSNRTLSLEIKDIAQTRDSSPGD